MAAVGEWIGPTYYSDAMTLIMEIAENTGESFSDIPDSVLTSSLEMEQWLADRGVYTNIIGDTVTCNSTPTGSVTQVINAANSSSTRTVTSQPSVMQEVSVDAANHTVTTRPFTPNGLYTFAMTASQAVTAAGVGISLGKIIDGAIYNTGNFFGWENMESFNPETWSTITNGDEGLGYALFNMVFGIDPATNATQAYIDSDTFAYMAMWLAQQGMFNAESITISNPEQLSISPFTIPCPMSVAPLPMYVWPSYSVTPPSVNGSDVIYAFTYRVQRNYFQYIYASRSPFTYTINSTVSANYHTYTYNGKTAYMLFGGIGGSSLFASEPVPPLINGNESISNSQVPTEVMHMFGWCMAYGTTIEPAVEGTSNQEGATLPNPSTWNDINTTKINLEETYPELAQQAITYPVYDPDTQTVKQRELWPIPMPNVESLTDTEPVGGTATSQQEQTITDTSIDSLKELITDILSNVIDGNTGTSDPPTGEGSTPTPVSITGAASSLWAVYNPTQAQIDSLGAWLWSSNFLDVIAKMWQDPMQGIISLHKVYMIPTTGAAQNIKVGYLDSGVSAATIPSQYGSVTCGHVSLAESYGNVFDYRPYTDVKIYLPFVGVVPLDVGEVMRADITVNYDIDWYTGAMLATVIVSRDGNEVMLYQYPTNGAVRYPLSQGTNAALMGLVVGGAVGALGGALTGGAFGAITQGAIGASKGFSANIHPDISHGGTLSGNVGAMAIKKPYLIVSKPMPYMPNGYQDLIGNPDYNVTALGSLSGFVRCQAMHIENIPCTDTEMRMINQALLEGVLV